MIKTVFLSIWICCILDICSTFFIVPEEVLSLGPPIYSQYPTIHAGTDSRFGWGFRLGRYADFQIMVELGPQTYTQPIRKYKKATGSASLKRSTADNGRYNIREPRQKEKGSNNIQEAAVWLRRWSEEVKKRVKPSETDEHNKKIDTNLSLLNEKPKELESDGHGKKVD